MLRDFEFYETLRLCNSYGKKVIDCREGRGFTVSYKHVEKEIFEISVTDCIPENLNVEILLRDDDDKVEQLAPNRYLVTRDKIAYSSLRIFVKSTKFFKQVDPTLPCQISKESCIVLEDKLLKNVKVGEITVCQFQPYEGVIIDAEIKISPNLHDPESFHYEMQLKSKTHVLQLSREDFNIQENILLSFFPGQTSPSAVNNADESSVTHKKQVDPRFRAKKAAITLKIYEKKKSFQEKIDAHGPTNVNIKTSDKKIVKVHKETLIAKSPVLAALLDSEEEIPHEIEVNYDAESVFRAMTFVYDNEKLEIAGFEPECYKFAEEFGMPELKQKSLKSMEEMNWQEIPTKHYMFAFRERLNSVLQKYNNQFDYWYDEDRKDFAKHPAAPIAPIL